MKVTAFAAIISVVLEKMRHGGVHGASETVVKDRILCSVVVDAWLGQMCVVTTRNKLRHALCFCLFVCLLCCYVCFDLFGCSVTSTASLPLRFDKFSLLRDCLNKLDS